MCRECRRCECSSLPRVIPTRDQQCSGCREVRSRPRGRIRTGSCSYRSLSLTRARLENDREGYRKLVQNDSNERGRQLAGYYHTATLGPQRVREVFPDHQLPVECKHYYAREAHSRPDSDPLSHPKVEVAYQTSRTDDTLHLTDENLAELDEELTEWLYAILADAGLDLRANENVYVEDEYFAAENGTTTASVVDLDLTEVRHEQESVVYKHLADGMAPTDQECLDVLVSDGGAVSPQDLAESTGRHEDTVYNSLARMNDLVTHTYGEVSSQVHLHERICRRRT